MHLLFYHEAQQTQETMRLDALRTTQIVLKAFAYDHDIRILTDSLISQRQS